jgi:hypothetical protein
MADDKNIHKDIDAADNNSHVDNNTQKETTKEQRAWLDRFAPNKHFVFLFGNSNAGKSMMLASLLRWIRDGGSNIGNYDVMPTNDRSGIELEQSFRRQLNDGQVVARTKQSTFVPLYIRYTPIEDARNLPSVDVVFLEASGEDHAKIYITNSSSATFPSGLNDYIRLRDISMLFLMVSSFRHASEDYEGIHIDSLMMNLFDYVAEKNPKLRRDARFFALVSQWDAYKKEGGNLSIEDFMKRYLRQTYNRLGANNCVGAYSVGEIEGNEILEFDNHYPEQLWKHIYQKFTGRSLDEEMPKPPEKPLSTIDKIKKNIGF